MYRYYNKHSMQYLSMCMIWLMASKRTAFLAFECWTFFDFGGSYNRSRMHSVNSCPTSETINTNVAIDTWALFRMVSRHSFNLPWMAGSSTATTKKNEWMTFCIIWYHYYKLRTILPLLINWSSSFYWGICLGTSYILVNVTVMLHINSLSTWKYKAVVKSTGPKT